MAKIILFEHEKFRGDSLIVTGPIADLGAVGWNDKTSSLIGITGNWLVFEHINFEGRSWPISFDGGSEHDGCYPFPAEWGGGNDEISSLKPL